MGNDQSSQKNKQREHYQYQLHNAASNPPKRRASSAPSNAFRPPSQPPPSPAPPPYTTTDVYASPIPPVPDGKQTVETNPFRTPVSQSPRRTKSHGTHVVPRRSQLLAGTGHVHMPTIPATTEEVLPMPMPMPMPEPHPAPPSQIQFPVPTISTVREEPIIRRNSREDPLTMLRKYDTVIIVCLTFSTSSAC